VIAGGNEVSAMLVTCANCHGRDGRGMPEGGLIPPDLTWAALTKPYGTVRPDGRTRPPYTDVLMTRAVTLGIDSAGAPMNAAMPRYRLSLDECADLLSYLKRLGRDPDPGLTDAEVYLGVILPPGSADQGEAVRGILGAYVDTLNRSGGIYHRRLRTRFFALPRPPEERAAALESFVDSDPSVFALISIDLAGVDPTPANLAERRRVPLIAVTAAPAAERPVAGSWVFALLAGPDDQALALARVARQDARAEAPFAVVHGSDTAQVALARATGARFGQAKLSVLDVEVGNGDKADEIRRATAAVVLLGPPGRMTAWLTALAKGGEVPPVIVPGALADRDLIDAPRAFGGRIALALALDPSDRTAEGLAYYQDLARKFDVNDQPGPAQLAGLSAVELLVEALKRAGREVDRERLVGALEEVRDFRTGLVPPLTFGPNRRDGAPGAHPVAVDLSAHRLVPTGRWLEADPPSRLDGLHKRP
jgi:ABC-type branched-subunit amino acid transport system substrate-binding protein